MKVLVFGSEGMLGSVLTGVLEQAGHQVWPMRRKVCDITQPEHLRWAFAMRADVAVNCAGIVKSECRDPAQALAVNMHAPHLMATAARNHDTRLVHISTDCVFSGKRGSYREEDVPDPEDLYGQTKAAGEIKDRSDCLTLRTSFIGWDRRSHRGLLEWLKAQKGSVFGYTKVRWSGLSAQELSRAIALAINAPDLSGLYHVVGHPITKADLLELLVHELGLDQRITRVDEPVLDRTMEGYRFSEATGYVPPTWTEMAKELAGA